MARYFIETLKCGEGEGMGCGPIWGPTVAEAKVREEDGSVFYLSLAEMDGYNFFETKRSTLRFQIDPEAFCKDKDKRLEELDDGLVISGYADEVFDYPEEEHYDLYRLMFCVIEAYSEEDKEFIRSHQGKFLDEIDIPVSRVEQDYIDSQEEDSEEADNLEDSEEVDNLEEDSKEES